MKAAPELLDMKHDRKSTLEESRLGSQKGTQGSLESPDQVLHVISNHTQVMYEARRDFGCPKTRFVLGEQDAHKKEPQKKPQTIRRQNKERLEFY
jgi:hypothetical protein